MELSSVKVYFIVLFIKLIMYFKKKPGKRIEIILKTSLNKRSVMINVTRLNDSKIVINSELIEFVEALPDTIVTLTTGQKILVRESVEEIVDMVKEYKRSILHKPITEE